MQLPGAGIKSPGVEDGFVEMFQALTEGLHSLYLYGKLEMRNVELEMLGNRTDVGGREMEPEKCFKGWSCK